MNIAIDMDLSRLGEDMYINGDVDRDDEIVLREAHKMRSLILADAQAYEWEKTSDIEDVDWFRMLKIAQS